MMSRASLIPLLFLLTTAVYAEKDESEWQQVRDENEIQVYTLDMQASEIIKAKAIAIIDAPLNEIQQLLEDFAQRHEWVPYLKQSQLVEAIDENQRIEYSHFRAPWPASDRDFVYRVKLLHRSETMIHYQMTSVRSAKVPEQEGMIRAELIESAYRLSAIDERTTRVELIYHADPKGWLPNWLVNMIQVALPYRVLSNLKLRFNQHEPDRVQE